jgi:hypothetical protein
MLDLPLGQLLLKICDNLPVEDVCLLLGPLRLDVCLSVCDAFQQVSDDLLEGAHLALGSELVAEHEGVLGEPDSCRRRGPAA